MGQGLVGLLVTGLLRANGARVMAVDLDESRRAYAEAMGAERVVISSKQDLQNEVREWTDGIGVDATVVCVGTDSNTPIEQCAEALRDRGRMVDVGITKIELPWRVFPARKSTFVFPVHTAPVDMTRRTNGAGRTTQSGTCVGRSSEIFRQGCTF